MKICILAVCLFGLALAAPGGDRGDKGGKGGPRGPIGGLVKLCMSLAEEAEEKREFDYESALFDICEFLLAQTPDDEPEDELEERSFWEYARGPGGKKGPKPTGEPKESDEGKKGGEGKGPKPTGEPSERSFWEFARGPGGKKGPKPTGEPKEGSEGKKGVEGKKGGEGKGPKPTVNQVREVSGNQCRSVLEVEKVAKAETDQTKMKTQRAKKKRWRSLKFY